MTKLLPAPRRLLFLGLPAALALVWLPAARATPPADEQKVIDRLIQRIERRGTMIFIRNGREYDAANAARHMRSKFEHFKDRIVTAEDFIELCATRSELTGEPYKIKRTGGAMRNAGDFMIEELRLVREELKRTG